jgi:hypothetical protein
MAWQYGYDSNNVVTTYVPHAFVITPGQTARVTTKGRIQMFWIMETSDRSLSNSLSFVMANNITIWSAL